jgi:hypothetical protein
MSVSRIIDRLRNCANEVQIVCQSIGHEPRFLAVGLEHDAFLEAVREAMTAGILAKAARSLERGRLLVTQSGRCPLLLIAKPSAGIEGDEGVEL